MREYEKQKLRAATNGMAAANKRESKLRSDLERVRKERDELIEKYGGPNGEMSRENRIRMYLDRIRMLEKVRDDALKTAEHTNIWYAVRWERLKKFLKPTQLWKDAACIMANGTQSPEDPPTYDQIVQTLKHERDAALAWGRELKEALKPWAMACTDDDGCGDCIGSEDHPCGTGKALSTYQEESLARLERRLKAEVFRSAEDICYKEENRYCGDEACPAAKIFRARAEEMEACNAKQK